MNSPIALLLGFVMLSLAAGCSGGLHETERTILTYTEPQGDQTSAIVEALGYSSRFPGIEIKPLPVPTAVLDYEPYVLSLSTSSTAIDAYLLDSPWVKRYSATNWLVPVDARSAGIDLSAFREELIDITSIGEGADRKLLAIPFETKGTILFYRADLLEEYGFDPPDTWEDVFAQCSRILDDREGAGPAFGFLIHGRNLVNDFYPIMWGFGGRVIDDQGNLTINSPENVRALAMIKRMLGIIAPDSEQMALMGLFDDYQAVDRLFAAGEAIFMINWNNRWGDLERGIDGQTISIDQVGVAPIPSEPDMPHFSNIGSWCWGVNYLSRDPNKAIRFITLITSYEAQRWRAINNGLVPARWDVLEDAEVREKAGSVLKLARVFEKVQLRARPFQREINNKLDEILIATLSDNLDPLVALDEAQSQIEDELAWVSRSESGEIDEQ